MAKGLYMGFDDIESKLSKLEGPQLRAVTRKVITAGAKVLEKEVKNAMEEAGHVRHKGATYMQGSVAMGDIYEELSYTSVTVGPRGDDPLGVSNEMKDKIIQVGYWNKETGSSRKKRDPYMSKSRVRARIAPKLLAVMNYQMKLCLEEIFGK